MFEISLRDYFAAHALAAVSNNRHFGSPTDIAADVAAECYEIADEMLEQSRAYEDKQRQTN